MAPAVLADVVHAMEFCRLCTAAQIAERLHASIRQVRRALTLLTALGVSWTWDSMHGYVLHVSYATALAIIDEYAKQ